ncbi:MAG: NAD(P)/FAD-dependent oxidoreductase [Candidatus Acetothermia bacterium]
MKIGDTEFRNEFIMAPVKTGYNEGQGEVTRRHLEFYDRRAAHVGGVIPEPFYLDRGLRELPTQMGIDSEDKLSGLRELTGVVGDNGAKAIAHLNHPGRMANPKIDENYYVSSTDVACENGGAEPKRMTEEDIFNAKVLFRDAAVRAEEAGFDLIELQFGHGYLVAQFLSKRVNDREDRYGGSFENRARFGLEVLQEVKEATNLPVQVRLSGDEMVEGGIDFEESKEFARRLVENGVDGIHVSAGTVCTTPPWYFQHMFTPKGRTWEMASMLKEELPVPITAVGQINGEEDVDKIKKNEMADFLAVGRALVADPDFVGKYTGEIHRRIRPCLACSDGCLGGVKSGEGLGCLMNPAVKDFEGLEEPEVEKEVAVVGGGLAGMSAARTLDERGHDVTLYEKDELGGIFNFAPLPPGKDPLQKGIDYFISEVRDREIEVVKKEARKEDLEGYDHVVVATGARPVFPEIEGLDDYRWAEVLKEDNIPSGKKVMVIGGGLVGVETTKALAEKENEVTLVEILPEVGGNMIGLEKAQLLNSLGKRDNVEIATETDIERIEDDKVFATKNGEKLYWEGVEEFVVVTGVKSYNPLDEEELAIPSDVIGDAREPAKAEDAIKSGYQVAKRI